MHEKTETLRQTLTVLRTAGNDALADGIEAALRERDAEWNAALEAAAKTHDDAGDRARTWLDAHENVARPATVEAMRTRLETHRQSAISIRALKRPA